MRKLPVKFLCYCLIAMVCCAFLFTQAPNDASALGRGNRWYPGKLIARRISNHGVWFPGKIIIRRIRMANGQEYNQYEQTQGHWEFVPLQQNAGPVTYDAPMRCSSCRR